MKGSLVTSQKPQADGTRNKAVVRKAIADAVAAERKAMKLEQAAKQTIEEAAPVQKREVKADMAKKATTSKKTTTKAAVKTTAVKAEVKETAVKAEEPKATATPIKSVTPAKAAVKEAVKEVVKETAAKAAPVKAAAKEVATKAATTAKAAAKKTAVTEEVFVQYGNREIMTKDIVEKVKAAYIAEGHDADGIKKIRMYVKPEENMVYYVVNDGYASGVSLY